MKKRIFFCFIILFVMTGCADDEPEHPQVLEIRAIPNTITLNDEYFYPKPFSILAKYSDNTEKNITSRVSWISENLTLLAVNQKGELRKKADCLESKCMISLIATDPESGISIRLTAKMNKKNLIQKKPPLIDELLSKSDKKLTQDVKKKRQDPALEFQDSDAFEVDVDQEVEREIEQEDNEKHTGNVIQNLQFSPQAKLTATDLLIGNFAGKSTVANQFVNEKESIRQKVSIYQLTFDKEFIELSSGEQYSPVIKAIDLNGEIIENLEISYECYSIDEFGLSVLVMSNCQLNAQKPGDAIIGINQDNLDVIKNETLLRVRVNPIILKSSPMGINQEINLTERRFQVWYQISNLDISSYYLAKLDVVFSQGLRLSVFTRPNLQYPTCLNTLPIDYSSVACYFQVANNDVMIVVENILQLPGNATLTMHPVGAELFQNAFLWSQKSPVKLTMEDVKTAFIFANESGGNNKHYYVYETDEPFNSAFFIKLYGISAAIKLNVNWAGGFCNESMMKVKVDGIVCQIPAFVSGKIYINIDGNNGESGVLNGPAAANGGTAYELLVSKVE